MVTDTIKASVNSKVRLSLLMTKPGVDFFFYRVTEQSRNDTGPQMFTELCRDVH